MSKQKLQKVQFTADGELIQMITDDKTARAIRAYNDVCNKVNSFDVTIEQFASKHPGFVCEKIIAQSNTLKIVCIKEYLPDVLPEVLDSARYECGIKHTKTNQIEMIDGGVQALYYNLFRGRTK